MMKREDRSPVIPTMTIDEANRDVCERMVAASAAEMARSARDRRDPIAPRVDYAERLFKIKQLEVKRDAALAVLKLLYIDGEDIRAAAADFANCCTQIDKLLEDE